jgi:hypothetical protein
MAPTPYRQATAAGMGHGRADEGDQRPLAWRPTYGLCDRGTNAEAVETDLTPAPADCVPPSQPVGVTLRCVLVWDRPAC